MKSIFIFSVLLILFAKLSAQTWAPNGANWHYSFNQMMSYGYLEIDYTIDTIILGKDCKTFQKTQFGYSYPGVYDTLNLGKEFTYLDTSSNIVYRYFDSKFDTLYDFNAQTGDEWKVHGMHISPDSGIVVVDSIGYRVINSDTLKSIFVSTINGSCIGWYSAEIVERIGCINDYMFPNYVTCIADFGEGGALRCYSDDNFPIFVTGESSYCDIITSIDTHVNIQDFIAVYPNPTSSNFSISNIDRETKYKIFNNQGKVLQQGIISTSNEINIMEHPKGIYLIKLEYESYSIVKKIIKK